MKKIILIHKKEGQTPLEALEVFRAKNPEYKDQPITYAGRLDPMASGLLILLSGEKTREKEKYLALTKEYEFEVLFGFATDTYDILGKIISADKKHKIKKVELKKLIEENLLYFKGIFTQQYPIYSSKTVEGKPLFEYARNNENVEIPTRQVSVKDLKCKSIKKIQSDKLFKNIKKRIFKVTGDFRQKEIFKLWEKNLHTERQYFIARFEVRCGSGTYVRSIAHGLGEKMHLPALAFSIKRTKIGRWKLEEK